MFEQNTLTKEFLKQMDYLLDTGVVETQAEVAEKISSHRNTITIIKRGERNLPRANYLKFKEVYGEHFESNPKPTHDEYKDKYIALLESQVKNFDTIISELRELKELLKVKR